MTVAGSRNVLRGLVSGAGARIMAMAASLLSVVVVARLLGPEDYGAYAYALTVISLLSAAVQMGLPTLVMRDTGRGLATADWGLVRGIWIWSARAMMFPAVLASSALAVWLALGPPLASERAQALAIGLPLVTLLACSVMLGAVLFGLGQIILGVLPDQVLRPMLLAFVVYAIAAFGEPATASLAMGVHALAAVAAILLSVILVYKVRPAGLRQGTPPPEQMDTDNWRAALRSLTLVAAVQIATQNIDMVVLGIWRGDAEVGSYRIALSITQTVLFGMTVGTTLLHSKAAGLHATGQHAALQEMAHHTARLGFGFVVAFSVVLAIFGERLLALVFGPGFTEAAQPLMILLVGNLLYSFFGPATTLLALLGHEGMLLRASLWALGLKLLGCITLIPAYGAAGAAVATSIAACVLAVILAIAVRKRTGLSAAAV
jgi:O-antigen/teichoic acid export membrane protein